jgi:hypothetical protein
VNHKNTHYSMNFYARTLAVISSLTLSDAGDVDWCCGRQIWLVVDEMTEIGSKTGSSEGESPKTHNSMNFHARNPVVLSALTLSDAGNVDDGRPG